MIRLSSAGIAGFVLLMSATAWGQSLTRGTGDSITMGAPNQGRAAPARAPTAPAPPALPGARVEGQDVAPFRGAADMPPTEALFDAINRGDLTAAKDAIARGADIHGHNVLGLSPLELSVDLGRNQISFLLLSYRGQAGFDVSRGPVAPATPPTRAQQRAADRAAARVRTATRVAAPPGLPTPRLFAGDGGSPVPQAGFLGFGTTTR